MVLSVIPTRMNSRAIGAGGHEHVNARQPGPYSVRDAHHGRNSDATATLRGSPAVKGGIWQTEARTRSTERVSSHAVLCHHVGYELSSLVP